MNRVENWVGLALKGMPLTIRWPVTKDNAAGVPVNIDLDDYTTKAVKVEMPDGTSAAGTVAKSTEPGEDHIAVISVTAVVFVELGDWKIRLALDDEPIKPILRVRCVEDLA